MGKSIFVQQINNYGTFTDHQILFAIQNFHKIEIQELTLYKLLNFYDENNNFIGSINLNLIKKYKLKVSRNSKYDIWYDLILPSLYKD